MSESQTEVDLPVLDNSFEKGDSETEFQKRGLPDKKPKKSFLKPFLSVVAVLAFLLFFDPMGFFKSRDVDPRKAIIATETELYDSLSRSDWKKARQVLVGIPRNSDLQKINPWLNEFIVMQKWIKEREWTKAYEVEFSRMTLLKSVSGKAFNELIKARQEEARKFVVQELKVQEQWHACARDDLTALKNLYNLVSDKSVYKIEIREALKMQTLANRELLNGRYKKSLSQEAWAEVAALLSEWSQLLPADDLTAKTTLYKKEKADFDLYRHCGQLVLSGRVLQAVSEISGHQAGQRYKKQITELHESLLPLDDERGKFDAVFSALALGDWDEAFDLLQTIEGHQSNLALRIIIAHWSKISLLDSKLLTRRREYANHLDEEVPVIKDQIKILRLCKQIEAIFPPIKSQYLDDIKSQRKEHENEVELYLQALKKGYQDKWQAQDYPKAFELLEKILMVEEGHPWALSKMIKIKEVAENLLAEMVILMTHDKKMATERYQKLVALLPAHHPLLMEGEKILLNK
jgi:hypothetical protein